MKFRDWLKDEFTQNTINTYCYALKSSIPKLNIQNHSIHNNLFGYNDFSEFKDIVQIIKSLPNYKEIDIKAGNGAFNAGLAKYQEFLEEKDKGYIKENITNYNNVKFYSDLLKIKKNIILQGAPGTGKTYATAEIALSLIGEKIDYSNHYKVMETYQKYVDEEQIAFVTFHQSMDYEDFIEGLKPQILKNEQDNPNGINYIVEDGIFKKICKAAIKTILIVKKRQNS